MVNYVKRSFGKAPYLVMGGFHLLDHSPEEVSAVIAQLRGMGVSMAGPTHCTGEEAIAMFRDRWLEGFLPLGVGREIKT